MLQHLTEWASSVMLIWEREERDALIEQKAQELIAAGDPAGFLLTPWTRSLGQTNKDESDQINHALALSDAEVTTCTSTHIAAVDPSGDKIVPAVYLMDFVNALNQSRMLAFDGRARWFVQPVNKRSRFRPCGVGEVRPDDRARMFWFLIWRRAALSSKSAAMFPQRAARLVAV